MFTMSTRRYARTVDMLATVSHTTAKSALRNFQDEERVDLLMSGGSMSSSYNEYLNWLNGYGSYSTAVAELRAGFADGVTPMNYGIPYIDQVYLTQEFDSLLEEQVEQFSENTYCDVEAIQARVKNITRTVENFSYNPEVYGVGSIFYGNDAGHTKLYEYDNYVTYVIEFEVDAIIKNQVGFTKTFADDISVVGSFDVVYQLFN